MTFDVVIILLYAVLWIAVTGELFVGSRGLTVIGLLFGVTFLMIGVLGLKGFIAPQWLDVCKKAVLGITGVFGTFAWRGTPAHTGWPKWTGAAVVLAGGVCCILWALFSALYIVI